MAEEQVIKGKKSLFVEREHVTLSMKLVCAFAITYYILFFLFTTYIVMAYNTIFDKSYFDENLNDIVVSNHYTLFITKWILLALIITSLFLVFFKIRWGKPLFMIFTIILVILQVHTTYPPAWLTYFLEIAIVLIIAPLRVMAKFTEKIQTETQKINPFKDKK